MEDDGIIIAGLIKINNTFNQYGEFDGYCATAFFFDDEIIEKFYFYEFKDGFINLENDILKFYKSTIEKKFFLKVTVGIFKVIEPYSNTEVCLKDYFAEHGAPSILNRGRYIHSTYNRLRFFFQLKKIKK